MTLEVVNAYVDGSDLVVLHRENGGLSTMRRRAEYSFFVRTSELEDGLRASMRASRSIVALQEQGSFTKVSCIDDWVRKDLVHGRRVDGGRRPSPFQERGIEMFEGDVDPVRRWFTDSGATIAKPRRGYYDFETDSRRSIAEAKKGAARVLCWSVANEEEEVVARGVLEVDSDEDERRLLSGFFAAAAGFDQMLAWNGDEFDEPVAEARANRLGLHEVDMRRWLWLDHLKLYRRMNLNSAESGAEKQSMRLEAIAQATLGEGKEEVPAFVAARWPNKRLAEVSWELWEAGGEFRDVLVRYNDRDTLLLPKIERATGFVALFDTLADVCRVLPNSRGLLPTQQMDGFMLRLGAERDHRFATRKWKEGEEERESFAGAFVMEPKRLGMIQNVHVVDFASLYPAIIQTWNMSPETKRAIPVNGPIPPGHCRSPKTGIGFTTEFDGILPIALREMIRLRKEWSEKQARLPPGTPEAKEAARRSMAYKVAANSFYGVVGSPYSRYFDYELAESVTQNGVWLIQETIAAAEGRGMEAIYGDSVTRDRTVVLKDPRGDVRILPFEKAWEYASVVGRSDKEMATLRGWKALTEKGWWDVEAIVRHRAKKPVYLVSTKHGQTKVTEDHSIMVGGKEVRPADFVARGLRFETVDAPEEEPLEVVDLANEVDEFEIRWPYKNREVVRRFVADGESLVLDGWGDFSKVRIKRFYRRGSSEMAALIRLVGAYVSDGSASLRGTTTSRFMLSFCKANETLQKQLAYDLRTIFEGGDVFGPYWSDTTFVVRSGTSAMACLFAAMCGFKSAGKRLPKFAFKLSPEDRDVLNKALEDGDGWIDPAGQLVFTSTSPQLAAGVSYLLSQQNIEHGFSYREEKGAWSIRTRPRGSERNRYSIKSKVEEEFDGYVYDLTVEGAHTFVDGIGRVLLHNTDSAFFLGNSKTEMEVFVRWCNDELYPELLERVGCKKDHRAIKLAYEKAFGRIVLITAKRYAGIFDHYKGTAAKPLPREGEDFDKKIHSRPEIKGLEFKRGDATVLARGLQEKVIMDLLRGDEREETYRAHLEAALSHVSKDDLPLEEVVLSKSLSKKTSEYHRKTPTGKDAEVPPHVKVAERLQAAGKSVGEGMRVAYVVIDGSDGIEAISADEYSGVLDRYYLWEKLVYPPTMRVLQAVFPNADWSEGLERIRPKKPRKKGPVAPAEQGALFATTRDPVAEASTIVLEEMVHGREDLLEMIARELGGPRGDARVLVVIRLSSGAEAVLEASKTTPARLERARDLARHLRDRAIEGRIREMEWTKAWRG